MKTNKEKIKNPISTRISFFIIFLFGSFVVGIPLLIFILACNSPDVPSWHIFFATFFDTCIFIGFFLVTFLIWLLPSILLWKELLSSNRSCINDNVPPIGLFFITLISSIFFAGMYFIPQIVFGVIGVGIVGIVMFAWAEGMDSIITANSK